MSNYDRKITRARQKLATARRKTARRRVGLILKSPRPALLTRPNLVRSP